MISGVRIYIEGHPRLRSGFQSFFKSICEKARERKLKWDVVMGGGQVVRDFMKALRSHPESLNILLMDSEGPDNGNLFTLLNQRSDWSPPANAVVDRDQIFWMVQVMEAWFLADRNVLRQFYGSKLLEASLPGNKYIEAIRKDDVLNSLKKATRETGPGQYHKTVHAPKLLSLLSPEIVMADRKNKPHNVASFLAALSLTGFL